MNLDITFRNIKTAKSRSVTDKTIPEGGHGIQYIPRLAATPVEPEPTA